MQRLFSTFPGRWPGVGLLLLRAAVGVWAAIEGVVYLLDVGGPGVSETASLSGDLAWWVVATGALAVLSGAALLIGFLTPVAALAIAVLSGGRALPWIPPTFSHASDAHAGAWFMMIIALGIFLLGPGAYSVDSYLFGRREIIIPPPADASRLADR